MAKMRALMAIRVWYEEAPEVTYTVSFQPSPQNSENARALIVSITLMLAQMVMEAVKELNKRLWPEKGDANGFEPQS